MGIPVMERAEAWGHLMRDYDNVVCLAGTHGKTTSNSVLMPIVALLTCILIGHVVGTKVIADEVKEGAGSFHREKLHRVMVRWVAPVMLAAILASELATKVFHLFTI